MIARLTRMFRRRPTPSERYDTAIKTARRRQIEAIHAGDPDAFETYRRDVQRAVERYVREIGGEIH